MKKLTAILGIIIAAPGFVAFGQNWVTVQESGNNLVYDDFETPGSLHIAPAGAVNLEVLWALPGTIDPLPGTPVVGDPDPPMPMIINSMLSSGWSLMQNYNSGNGSAALGTVETTSGGTATKGGSIVAFNGGNPFEFEPSSFLASGSSIQVVWLGFPGSSSSYLGAPSLGVSAESTVTVGTTEGDPNATSPETSPPFAVTTLPEPTTLALTGLGGLSMLMLRRRSRGHETLTELEPNATYKLGNRSETPHVVSYGRKRK